MQLLKVCGAVADIFQSSATAHKIFPLLSSALIEALKINPQLTSKFSPYSTPLSKSNKDPAFIQTSPSTLSLLSLLFTQLFHTQTPSLFAPLLTALLAGPGASANIQLLLAPNSYRYLVPGLSVKEEKTSSVEMKNFKRLFESLLEQREVREAGALLGILDLVRYFECARLGVELIWAVSWLGWGGEEV